MEKKIEYAEITQEMYQKMIDGANEYLKIQGYNGNWNYDPYMHGMYEPNNIRNYQQASSGRFLAI